MVYDIDELPLKALIGPVVRATESVARLDERLARSPVREGFGERQNFADAAAALWLEGELVHVEDLVLHDAHMDIRAPTHELTRAHAVLRARRQIFARPPDWALGRDGLRHLTGRGDGRGGEEALAPETKAAAEVENAEAPDTLAEEFAAIDAVIARSSRLLDGARVPPRPPRPEEPPDLIHDLDWDEDARLAAWRAVADETGDLPAMLRAAILLDAWHEIEVLQRGAWVGPLLVAALLRREGVAVHHLAAVHVGLRAVPRERRRARDRGRRLLALLDAFHETARAGLKEHDRLILAKGQMERRLGQRRASSRLPALVALVLSRPLVSTGMIQERLKVSKQGAINLVGELALREMTGRGRFRAWGIV